MLCALFGPCMYGIWAVGKEMNRHQEVTAWHQRSVRGYHQGSGGSVNETSIIRGDPAKSKELTGSIIPPTDEGLCPKLLD